MVEVLNPIISRFQRMKRELNQYIEQEKLDCITDQKAQQFLIKYKKVGYYD